MEDLFLNFPTDSSFRSVLHKTEYGRLRKAIERASKIALPKLCRTSKFVRKSEDLYLLKLKSQSNPRMYFTDLIPGYLVFLHGIKKKQKYEEDPADERTSQGRLERIRSKETLEQFFPE